jgi:hypothetical protein
MPSLLLSRELSISLLRLGKLKSRLLPVKKPKVKKKRVKALRLPLKQKKLKVMMERTRMSLHPDLWQDVLMTSLNLLPSRVSTLPEEELLKIIN